MSRTREAQRSRSIRRSSTVSHEAVSGRVTSGTGSASTADAGAVGNRGTMSAAPKAHATIRTHHSRFITGATLCGSRAGLPSGGSHPDQDNSHQIPGDAATAARPGFGYFPKPVRNPTEWHVVNDSENHCRSKDSATSVCCLVPARESDPSPCSATNFFAF
ncbi:hypothetical protein GQR58_029235 [Nymphon striatum]|nr:hypothetical protein GQR58_029235 [Nymphon striatum]